MRNSISFGLDLMPWQPHRSGALAGWHGRKLIHIAPPDFKRVHRPAVRRALARAFDLIGDESRIELIRDLRCRMSQCLDNPYIPIGMKIVLRTLRRRESDAIAALVVVIGGVQRLVQIADQMNQKLECE